MVGSPYLIPGFIMAMVFVVIGGYWQAVILMLAVVYVADDFTFYQLLFFTFVFLIVAFLRRDVTANYK